MIRTVRYRIRANNKKKYSGLESTAGSCRFVWNQMWNRFKVNDYKDDYRHGVLGNILRDLKADIKNVWLKDVSAYILQHSLQDFSRACSRYKKGMAKEPKPKSKLKTVPSFPVNYHSAKVSGNNWLRIFGIGWLKLIGSDPYPDVIFRSGRIKKECGKWYAYLVFETEEEKKEAKETCFVAIDRNSRQVTFSDGRVFYLPEINPKLEARKLRLERRLANQRKGSNRWWVTKLKLQKVSRNIYNVLNNWRHQVTKLLSGYTVILEDLNTKEMTNKTKKGKLSKMRKKAVKSMNKNILNTGWSDLERLLAYKCNKVEKIDPAYTSQTCSRCGYIKEGNRKSQSQFKCLNCGYELNADINASFNIFDTGLEKIGGLWERVIWASGTAEGRQKELLVTS